MMSKILLYFICGNENIFYLCSYLLYVIAFVANNRYMKLLKKTFLLFFLYYKFIKAVNLVIKYLKVIYLTIFTTL